MRNSEIIRQWRILKTIESSTRASTVSLAREQAVTERTVRRDIEALQEAGFPLYDERAEGRRVWRLVEGYRQRVTQTFTLAELAALYFGRNLMSFLGGAPFAQDLESAFTKIRKALPERALPYLARIQELFAARPDPWKDYSEKQDVIAALIDAVLHQHPIRVDYFSFNSRRRKRYTLDPYRVVYYRGGLYLYARAHEYDAVRTFAVERIQRIEVMDQTFSMPTDFNVSEYARGAFGIAGGKAEKLELLFDAEMAGYIRERVWHESQELQDQPDGSIRLQMEVAPGFELKSWIKGFLPHVRVVRPKTLRDQIAAELEAARGNYPVPAKPESKGGSRRRRTL